MESMQSDVGGSLQVDKTEASVHHCVKVHWDFSNSAYVLNSRDFIGVFEVGDSGFENILDRKEKGENSIKHGSIKWRLKAEGFDKHTTVVNFCYFQSDGVLLSKSPPLVVINPEFQSDIQSQLLPSLAQNIELISIEVYDVHCTGLHWRFHYPNPVLEFHLTHPNKAPSLPHHGQKVTSTVLSMTINPRWPETFTFTALPSDLLKIEVRNSVRKVRSFWGKVNIPLIQFLRWTGETFILHQPKTLTFALEKRLPSDSAAGTITLSVRNRQLDPTPEGINQMAPEGINQLTPEGINQLARDGINQLVPEGINQLAPEGINQLAPECTNQLALEGTSQLDPAPQNGGGSLLVQGLGTEGQDMEPSLSAPAALVINPILASDSDLGIDRAVLSSPDKPQGGESSAGPPHNNEGAAPVVIISKPSGGDQMTADRQKILNASRSYNHSDTVRRHTSLLRSASLHVRHSRRSFKQGHGLSPSHAAAIAEITASMCEPIAQSCVHGSGARYAEGVENSSAAAQNSQENKHDELDQILPRLFEFIDTPCEEKADEKQLEPKGEPVPHVERLQSIDDELRSSPGFKFITRPDLYQYAQAQNNALMSNLKAMRLVQAIRSDHSNYATLQHNEAMVAVLNSFARTDWALPSGWVKKIDHRTKKAVFIDHNAHLTTFIDPRLPYPGNEGQASSEGATPPGSSQIQMRTRAVVSTAPPAPSSHDASPAPLHVASPQTYSDHVVAFLRQPNIFDTIDVVCPDLLTPDLRAAISNIREVGVHALEDYQNSSADVSVQLVSLLSLFEEEISLNASRTQQPSIARITEAIDFLRGSDCDNIMAMLSISMSTIPPEYTIWARELCCATADPHELLSRMQRDTSFGDFMRAILEVLNNQSVVLSSSLPRQETETPTVQTGFANPAQDSMENQNIPFQTKLQNLQAHYSATQRICITIRRDHILADAFRNITYLSSRNLQAHNFNVQWAGELGIDQGGPSREFFSKLSHQLFNPYYGLFQYSSEGSYSVEISPFASQINDALKWFQFAGMVIGCAIIQGQLLDVFFARHFYKAILNIPFSLSDIEGIDVSFYNSLVYLQENDPEDLQLTFSVEEECFGEIVETDLKKGGSKIPVTENNKNEYIKLMINWRLSRGVQEQMEALVNGLRKLVPLKHLTPFDARELEWVIAGTPVINFEDWKANTVYMSGYNEDHIVIKWFWEIVASYSNEQKLKLLQFVTGTSSIPFEGFKGLKSRPFTICFARSEEYIARLPSFHICYNTLDLPCYSSFETLKEKLTKAIEECEFFGFG